MNALTTAIAGVLVTGCVMAEEPADAGRTPPQDYVQAWLGALDTERSWRVGEVEAGDSLVGGLGTLPFGGGAAQRLWGHGPFRVGYEGGALVSWKNHDTDFFGSTGTGTLVVTTENTFSSIGVFMGAVASADLTPNLRFMVAAGPSLTWASLSWDDDESIPAHTGTIEESASDVSFVAYGRAGLEVVLSNGSSFGASVRYADDEFDLGASGELEVDEVLWLLTLGARL